MKRISGLSIIVLGGLLSAWALYGARTLHQLLQEEGTESFSTRIGLGGLLGCICFLVFLVAAGLLLFAYGVHVTRRPCDK
jgi:hypothetical protein